MGRKPGIPDSERLLRAELARALSSVIGGGRGAQSRAAKQLGISRQALSLYLLQKATPGSEILRRAFAIWNLSLDLRGTKFDSASFASSENSDKAAIPEQLSMFEALSTVDNQQLDVQVLRKGAHTIDLKVSIDFRKTS